MPDDEDLLEEIEDNEPEDVELDEDWLEELEYDEPEDDLLEELEDDEPDEDWLDELEDVEPEDDLLDEVEDDKHDEDWLEELEDVVDELIEEPDINSFFFAEFDSLFSFNDFEFIHFVWAEFNVYPSSQFLEVDNSGYFLQFKIDVHILSSVKITDSSKDNNIILNFLYLLNKDIKDLILFF